MKIQNDAVNVPLPVSSETGKISRKEGAGATPTGNSVGPNDSATTSRISHHLHADSARLERLREAVQNGTYSVSPQEVSKRLISEHLDDSATRS